VFIYRKQIKNLQFAYQNLVKKNLELDKASLSLKALEIKNTSKPNGIYIKDEEKIYLKLKALLEDEKIFRQQDLSESKLAELLNTNTSYLSSIINKRFKMPFKTLLNKYRVAEARNLLVSKKYSNFSIEGIATEVGYQSRSAFYAVFKQNTGMTPSAYVKAYTQLDD
jgi:AraC-like DNA-binding protein